MDNDEEDIQKIKAVLEMHQSSYQTNFQLEFEDFIENHEYNEESDNDEMNADIPNISNDVKTENTFTDITLQSHALTGEEISLINSTSNPRLKQLLILNRKKNLHLLHLYENVKKMINECRKNIRIHENHTKTVTHFVAPPNCKLAAPYFKNKALEPSPSNLDLQLKKTNRELSYYDIYSARYRWSKTECQRLIDFVKKNWRDNRPKKNDQDHPPLDNVADIDWYTIATQDLGDKHTPSECRAIWQIYLHPDINKQNWTGEENTKIEELAKKYQYQNWEEIAGELGTKRTAFTTCLHYQSHLNKKLQRKPFTPEEDQLLLELVDCFKHHDTIEWHKIVCYFDNRRRNQLYGRYTYYLKPQNNIKTKFSEAENILLMILVEKFGRNFRLCSEHMPHRSIVQLKCHYHATLKADIKKGGFTVEDDQAIMDHVKNSNDKNWSPLSTKLHRTVGQLRQRYMLIRNFLKTNPNKSLEDVPKRRHTYKDHYGFTKYLADWFISNDNIPTLQVIEDCLKVITNRTPAVTKSQDSLNVENIDNLIGNLFYEQKIAKINPTTIRIDQLTNNVKDILKHCNIRLDFNTTDLNNPNLDELDRKIVTNLKSYTFLNGVNDRILPPNLHTTLGLNTVFLHTTNSEMNANIFSYLLNVMDIPSSQLLWNMEQHLANFDESTRNQIECERELFVERFLKLFTWPAILSLDEQTEKRPLPSNLDHNDPLQCNPSKKVRTDLIIKNPTSTNVVDKNVVDQLIRNNMNVVKIDGNTSKLLIRKNNETINVIDKPLPIDNPQDETKQIEDDIKLLNEILAYEERCKK